VPAKVILEVVSGAIQGKSFAFESHDTFFFGRHSDCQARLPKDHLVSRHHFIVEVNPPDIRLRDLGSLNGTHVNGVRYGGRAPDELPADALGRPFPQIDLKHGDRITVGNTTIQVRVELPSVCGRCSAEIPLSDTAATQRRPGEFVCHRCRGELSTDDRPATQVEVARCDHCGKDVTAEAGARRRGAYICEECRTDLLAVPAGLKLLLQQTAGKHSGPVAPNVGGYEIGEQLGKGGFGAVYRAIRKSDGRAVAIKVMLAKIAVDERARERFLREIAIAEELRHPHIVSSLDSGAEGATFYFAMELCEGGSLADWVRRQGKMLSPQLAVPLMAQCLGALEHAHGRQVVHRDLKPSNVLLMASSGVQVAKLADFGLAKNFERAGLSGMTATGGYAGTFQFMPREQLTEFKYTRPTSDLWSIAATFYYLLAGRLPLEFSHERDPMDVVLHEEPVPIRRRVAHIPSGIADVIDRALLVEIAARYESAAEMREALVRAI